MICRWFCNDASVSRSTKDSVRTANAYLLFYRRTSNPNACRARIAAKNRNLTACSSECGISGEGPKEQVPKKQDEPVADEGNRGIDSKLDQDDVEAKPKTAVAVSGDDLETKQSTVSTASRASVDDVVVAQAEPVDGIAPQRLVASARQPLQELGRDSSEDTESLGSVEAIARISVAAGDDKVDDESLALALHLQEAEAAVLSPALDSGNKDDEAASLALAHKLQAEDMARYVRGMQL